MPDAIEAEIIEADPAYFLPESMMQPAMLALTADGVPVSPPREWFTPPTLLRPTPLQVTASGQVYGHIATWDSKHIGMPGIVRPPKSRSNYAFFATGSVLCADGSQFDGIGQITLVGGHAPLDVDVRRAVAHYDDTNSAVCDVAVGEDKHGIWVAGALRPGVEEPAVRQLRASAVSGDWRPINGNLELVAVCSVNVPGFPIPRVRVASGQPLALVAAGVETLVEERIKELSGEPDLSTDSETLTVLGNRIQRVEDWMLGLADPENETALMAEDALPESVEDAVTEEDPAEALRMRVRPSSDAPAIEAPVEAVTPTVASVRARVHGDPTLDLRGRVHNKTVTASAEDLRGRVHGGDDARPLG